MKDNKKVCIFCSSSGQIDKLYSDNAKDIAEIFAKNHYDLVFGGGAIGLMGVIAREFKKNGNQVISVIPDKLNKKGIVFEDSDEIIVTETMSERKKIMENISDSFIALPGGFGTLEEILEIITLKQLKYHNKAIAILNINNFFNGLIDQLDKLYELRFVENVHKNLYYISENPNKIFRYVNY